MDSVYESLTVLFINLFLLTFSDACHHKTFQILGLKLIEVTTIFSLLIYFYTYLNFSTLLLPCAEFRFFLLIYILTPFPPLCQNHGL